MAYKIIWPKTNIDGEAGVTLSFPLQRNQEESKITLQFNDNEPAIYSLQFHDSGTIWHSAMQGRFAIEGRLSNISLDWKKKEGIQYNDFASLNIIGSIDNGIASVYIWRNESRFIAQ